MIHPGDHYTQRELLEIGLPELSPACGEEFDVPLPSYQFQLQDHLRHSHWIALNPVSTAWHRPIHNGKHLAYWGIQTGHGRKKPLHKQRLYQCSPGSALTKVRVTLRQRIVARGSGRIEGARTVIIPMVVKRVRAKLKHRGALRGPC